MKKIAQFIVDKKNYIFILFIILIGFCLWGMTKVSIEYEITAYLPADTDTKKAIDIMDREFVTFGTATFMVRNISFENADELHRRIEDIDGVKSCPFQNTKGYYSQSSALFNVTFDGDDEDPRSVAAYQKVLETVSGYDVLISSPLVDTYADELQRDITFVLILAVIIIVVVLAFTSKSFGEIPVYLLTFGVAAILNMGTNYWFGKISFISNSVCVILQLALAIDYAIILCHRFAEEKANSLTAQDAMAGALAKAIPEIASSSLTTIAGLLALTTMALRLGADLGLVLAKSIVCSMISVFLFMPCVTLFFSKAIDKSTHRNLVPRITFIGKFDVKLRYVIPAVFLVAASVFGYFSFKMNYVYSTDSIDTDRPSQTQIAEREIRDLFGYSNQLAILVPYGDYGLEKSIINAVNAHDEVTEALGISNVEITANGRTHTLTEGLNYREFARLLGTDNNTAVNIYYAYAFFSGEDAQNGLAEVTVFEANRDIYTASLLELLDCAFEHDDFISAYLYDNDILDTYENLRDAIRDAEAQLIGVNYTRVVFTLDCEVEGEKTFALLEEMMTDVKGMCPEAIFAGDIMSSYDLDRSFSSDNLKISLLTVLFVFVILMFTFRSWGVPIALALTIQGAIFINFAIYAFTGTNLFFFVYLIVSAIQMGATIDYAIVFTTRYRELKKQIDKRTAAIEALNHAFPTILTSGSILAVSGFLIGGVVGDPLIATLGMCLGRGVLISIACVLFVLPAVLVLFDKLLNKTDFKPKRATPVWGRLRQTTQTLKKAVETVAAVGATNVPPEEGGANGAAGTVESANNDSSENNVTEDCGDE